MTKQDIGKYLESIARKYLDFENFSEVAMLFSSDDKSMYGTEGLPNYLEFFMGYIIDNVDADAIPDEYLAGRYEFKYFSELLNVLIYSTLWGVSSRVLENVNLPESVVDVIEEEHDDVEFNIGEFSEIEEYVLALEKITGMKCEVTGDKSSQLSKWDDLIDTKVQGILEVYEELYRSGYEVFKPDGLLSPNGMIVHKEGSNIKVDNALLEAVFNNINAQMGGVFSTVGLPNGNCKPSIENIEKRCYYYPHYQLRNLFGTDKDDASLMKYMSSLEGGKARRYQDMVNYFKADLTKTLKKALIDSGVDLINSNSAIINKVLEPVMCALQTCIVVVEYKKGICLKIKVCSGRSDLQLNSERFEQAIQKGDLFSSTTVVDSMTHNRGVYNITFVMDKVKFSSLPLFAFQALEAVKRTGRPDWGSVVLGKKVSDDTILRRSFMSNTDFLITLIAGSRSGKGVMTLSMLASAFGAGYPVFYTDFKPDMASTIYNIANKNGVETFAFDGSGEAKTINRGIDIYQDESSIPQELVENGLDTQEFIMLASYFRSLELCIQISKLRQKAVNSNPELLAQLGGERVVFVFDEFELFSIKYRDCFEKQGKVKGRVDAIIENITRNMKPDEKKNYEPFTYIENFKSWATSVISAFAGSMSATFGQGKVTIFMIWQHTNIEELGMPLANLSSALKTNAVKIVGNGTLSGVGSSVLGAAAYKGTPEEKYFSQFCFAISNSRGETIAPGKSTVFKPYLVLNEANGDYTKTLYERSPESKEIIEIDGVVREDVGFEGYVKELLGVSDIRPLLQESWSIAERVVTEYNFGSSLGQYMYDVHTFKIGSLKVGESRSSEDNYQDWVDGEEDLLEGIDSNESQETEVDEEYDSPYYGDTFGDSILDSVDDEVFQRQRENLSTEKGVINNSKGEKINTKKYQEFIFKDNGYNLAEDSFLNEESITESINMLSKALLTHIVNSIGVDRVYSVAEKDRYLIVNDVIIAPTVTKEIIEKLPYDIRNVITDGRWADVFIFGYTQHFGRVTELVFDDYRYFCTKISYDYGIDGIRTRGMQWGVNKLFKMHKKLSTITIDGQTFTRDGNNAVSDSFKTKEQSCNRSMEIDEKLRRSVPNNYSKGITSFYRNPNVGTTAKVVTTVGVGALAILACTNPIGMLTVGYLGGKTVVDGTKSVGRKFKNGFSGFISAFKDSI